MLLVVREGRASVTFQPGGEGTVNGEAAKV